MVEPLDEPPRPSPWKYVIGAAVVALVVLAVGAIGHLSGAGFFGYRTLLYGTGELYALNMGEAPLRVSVDGREPVEVAAGGAELLELIGGTSRVVVTDASGEVVSRHSVTAENSHAFLKLDEQACLAAVRLDEVYGGKAGETLDFVAKIEADEQLWVPASTNVVWPRKPFPTRLRGDGGPGIWLELVGCELLEEESFLDAYLALRLQERVDKAMKKPE